MLAANDLGIFTRGALTALALGIAIFALPISASAQANPTFAQDVVPILQGNGTNAAGDL
jgi:hypothetical protein